MIPKLLNKITLQLITPCFCAGAEQTQPELRAPSFRGELRWWFRCLGGSKAQENAVFGNAAGDSGRASAVSVRVTGVKGQKKFDCFFEQPKQKVVNSAYITYFLSANENSDREDSVVRSEAYLSPGTTFTLELNEIHPIKDESARELLMLAWRCLCNLGAVGARKTRALGAYVPVEKSEREAELLLQNERVKAHFESRITPALKVDEVTEATTTTKILTECARRLKEYRKDNAIHPTPTKGQKRKYDDYYGVSVLGNATNGRQTSAVRFRPIMNEKDEVTICILKAPACTVSKAALQHDIPKL